MKTNNVSYVTADVLQVLDLTTIRKHAPDLKLDIPVRGLSHDHLTSHIFFQDTHPSSKLLPDESPEAAAVWFDDPPTGDAQARLWPMNTHPAESGPQLIGEAPVSSFNVAIQLVLMHIVLESTGAKSGAECEPLLTAQ